MLDWMRPCLKEEEKTEEYEFSIHLVKEQYMTPELRDK